MLFFNKISVFAPTNFDAPNDIIERGMCRRKKLKAAFRFDSYTALRICKNYRTVVWNEKMISDCSGWRTRPRGISWPTGAVFFASCFLALEKTVLTVNKDPILDLNGGKNEFSTLNCSNVKSNCIFLIFPGFAKDIRIRTLRRLNSKWKWFEGRLRSENPLWSFVLCFNIKMVLEQPSSCSHLGPVCRAFWRDVGPEHGTDRSSPQKPANTPAYISRFAKISNRNIECGPRPLPLIMPVYQDHSEITATP